MPRDITAPRRTSRKLTKEEELELKRARGELSCAECKRLKLKCDKKIPCTSCVRRGCPTVCPYGSVINDQGSRFILTETEELHRKISEMSRRIRQLEDALELLQSSISAEKHPLLRDELLPIKHGVEQPELPSAPSTESPEDPLAAPVEAFGTLTIGDGGELRYFGATAGSETLFSAESKPENQDHSPPKQFSAIPQLLNSLAAMSPVGSGLPTAPETFDSAMSMLFACLPARPRAWSLCETFLEQASWVFRPLKREEVIQDILTPIYKAKQERENPLQRAVNSATTPVSPHKISVLYSILALGGLSDMTLPAFNEEGERYHHCARAALALRYIFDSPMVETVQAILVLSFYCGNFAPRYKRDSVWMLVSLASKVAQSIGMHRDPARWNMDATTAERRRILFWELYQADVFHSLELGRPPSIALSYVDCALPRAQSGSDEDDQFWNWKYQFNRNISESLIELTLSAKPPDYKAVLDIDRKLREAPMPSTLSSFLAKDYDCAGVGLGLYMKGAFLSMVRSVAMLYIHRNFFARALLDHPANPLHSPYATSFLAAARCASSIIRTNSIHIGRFPEFCMRWWNMWIHLFSAATIVGSIVTKAPSSMLAPAAFVELSLAVQLFENGSKLSSRIRTGMEILHRLQGRASVSLARYGHGAESPAATSTTHREGRDADIFAICGGQTHGSILSSQRSAVGKDHPNSASPQPIPFPVAASPCSADPLAETAFQFSTCQELPNVHPSLMEDIFIHPQGGDAPGSTAYPRLDNISQIFEPDATGVFEPSHSVLQVPQFSAPAGLPLEQDHPQTDFLNNSDASSGSFQQLFAETLSTDTRGMNDISTGELGTAANSGNTIDDDWMMFMKESGLA